MPDPIQMKSIFPIKTIEDVCDVNLSKRDRAPKFNRADDELTSYLPMSAVDELSGTIKELELLPYSEASSKSRKYFEVNDILFAKITPCMQNGKSVIAKGLRDGIGFCSTEFHILTCKEGKVIPEWIHFFLRRNSFRTEAQSHFTGTVGQQRVPDGFLKTHPIPIPEDIEVQRLIIKRVVSYLSEIQEMRAILEGSRLDVGQLIRSALNEIFRDAKNNPDKQQWKWMPLNDICERIDGGGTPKRSQNNNFGGNILWLTPSDLNIDASPTHEVKISDTSLTQNGYNTSSAKLMPCGTVLFSSRATIGKIAIAGKELCTNQGFANFVCKEGLLNNKYLAWCLRAFTNEIKKLAGTTTYLEVSRGNLKKFKIPIPQYSNPAQSLLTQEQLALELDGLHHEFVNVQNTILNNLDTINEVEQSIIENAFRGEL